MKKLLFALLCTAFVCALSFAQDVTSGVNSLSDAGNAIGEATGASESLQGTWYDKKYDANWSFQMNTGDNTFCILTDATTNAVIYRFTKNNVQKFKAEITNNAFTVSWESDVKNRIYRFSKSISADKDLQLDIFNNAYKERHSAKITYVAADARVN